MDWIKLPVRIRDDPRVGILAEKLGVSFHEALGRLVHVMTWCADHETRQLPASLDGLSRTALRDAGLIGPEGLVDWDECASGLSQARHYERDRKREYRRKLLITDGSVPGQRPGQSPTCPPESREENTREEKDEIETKTEQVNRSVSAKASTGVRLPVPFGFESHPQLLDFALKEGMSASQAATTLVEFADYWVAVPGARGRKVDWVATWRNRVREVLGRIPRRGKAPPIDQQAQFERLRKLGPG